MQLDEVNPSGRRRASAAVPPAEALAEKGTLGLVDLINEAEQLTAAGRWEDAFSLYHTWLKHSVSPLKYVAYFNYGTLLAADGKHLQAEQMYRTALESNRDFIQAHLNLGLTLEKQGRQCEAIAQWKRALTIESIRAPENRELCIYVLNNIGRLLAKTYDFGDALFFFEQSLNLDSRQEAVKSQLEELRHNLLENTETLLSKGRKPVIFVLACCFNEAAILPFFLDHYTNFVGATKIFLYDGGSTDGSERIVKDYPVEFIVEKHDKLDDSVLMHIRNEEWKKYRKECDWFIVCDVDEFLYHPDIRNKLSEYKRDGITLPMVEGSEMYSKVFPTFEKGKYLHQFITAGTPNPGFYNKNLIFDPTIDINYSMGCHHCFPTGNVKKSSYAEFKNLHYKLLSFDYLTIKAKKSNERLSDWNLQHGAGIHYKELADKTRDEFFRMYKAADNVLNFVPMPSVCRDGFVPAFEILLNREQDAVMVEVGTQRDYDGNNDGGGSTHLFAWYINRYGGELYSVDENRINVDNGLRELGDRRLLGKNINLVYGNTVEYLRSFGRSIDFMFFNSRNYRGTVSDLSAAELNVLQQFKCCEEFLADDAVILIDGVVNDVTYEGCGKLLIPYLMDKEYKLLHGTYQFLFKRSGG